MTEKYKVNIPAGKSGDWEVKTFTVTEEQAKFDRLRGMFHGGRYTPAGTYTCITRFGRIIMSDTPDEIGDHYSMINNAHGEVLINGLGIGMVLQAVLEKPEVTHATVIEYSSDVIALVGEHYKKKYGDRLTIICADALKWKPSKDAHYGAVWHDIWDNICSDNLPEMTKLHRKYAKISEWQGSWAKYECQMAKRRGGY